ncbi:MAG: CBS domain-containing protein [Chloroflexota bacterium]
MTEPRLSPEAVTQTTLISEADTILQMRPVIVHREASLQQVAEAAVENTACRVIAVTDAEDRLVGVIPVHRLVNDIFLKIVPEEALGEIDDMEAALEYARHVGARVAGEVMSEPVSVRLEDTVRDAFAKLQSTGLNGLPIIDAESQVVGYIDQLELLLVWVRASGRRALLEPSARDS